MSGWFAVKHGIADHEVFKGDFSRVGMFIWMVDNAAFKDTQIDIGGKPYTVPRGSLCFAQRFLATKFRLSTKALRTFLSELERHGIIKTTVVSTGQGTKTKRTQITLCNYEKYQSFGNNAEPKGKQKGNEEEQINNIPVGDADKSAPDLASVIFGEGLKLLMAAGKSRSNAASILGMWRKKHGDEATIAALGRAQREGAIDPVQFCEGVFRFTRTEKSTQDKVLQSWL